MNKHYYNVSTTKKWLQNIAVYSYIVFLYLVPGFTKNRVICSAINVLAMYIFTKQCTYLKLKDIVLSVILAFQIYVVFIPWIYSLAPVLRSMYVYKINHTKFYVLSYCSFLGAALCAKVMVEEVRVDSSKHINTTILIGSCLDLLFSTLAFHVIASVPVYLLLREQLVSRIFWTCIAYWSATVHQLKLKSKIKQENLL